MKRIGVVVFVTSLCGAFAFAQGDTPPRRLGFDFRPIATHLRPDDRNVYILHPQAPPLLAYPKDSAFVSMTVDWNPIIFVGRIVERQAAFLDLRSRQDFTEVSARDANWIGSRFTVLVERVVQTVDQLPLAQGQRLVFVDDGEGSAVINGVRVETRTPWLEPVVMSRRYLIGGRLDTGRLSVTGMWMEPEIGGRMRPRLREFHSLPKPGQPDTPEVRHTPFDDWTIDEASERLQNEIRRRASARR